MTTTTLAPPATKHNPLRNALAGNLRAAAAQKIDDATASLRDGLPIPNDVGWLQFPSGPEQFVKHLTTAIAEPTGAA